MFRPPTKYSEYLKDVQKSIDYILKRVNATTVNKIVAGTNVTISPADGTGTVTINASGGGGGGSNSNTLVDGGSFVLIQNTFIDAGAFV